MTILVCFVIIGPVVGISAINLNSHVRPTDKDTILMVLFFELHEKTDVLVKFAHIKNLL